MSKKPNLKKTPSGETDSHRILQLVKANEFGHADSILRTLEKGCPHVNYSQVNIIDYLKYL